jgi:chromosome segregation ATPase
MEKVLEQILEKLNSLDSKVTGLDNKVNSMEKTLNYHSEMFGALINAQETQKAQNDRMEVELANLSGKMDQGFSDIVEVQKSLIEMYGQHETEIRTLRRRPV